MPAPDDCRLIKVVYQPAIVAVKAERCARIWLRPDGSFGIGRTPHSNPTGNTDAQLKAVMKALLQDGFSLEMRSFT